MQAAVHIDVIYMLVILTALEWMVPAIRATPVPQRMAGSSPAMTIGQ
jgi:hypothetical protein